jgi:uncharacterized coiled-coil protein SlyX
VQALDARLGTLEGQLAATDQQVAAVEDQLARTRVRLDRLRAELRTTRMELKTAEDAAGARAGRPSNRPSCRCTKTRELTYLDVLLRASSFDDLVGTYRVMHDVVGAGDDLLGQAGRPRGEKVEAEQAALTRKQEEAARRRPSSRSSAHRSPPCAPPSRSSATRPMRAAGQGSCARGCQRRPRRARASRRRPPRSEPVAGRDHQRQLRFGPGHRVDGLAVNAP